jgi:hypothetical protein
VEFPTGVLQQLQQLTYLELAHIWVLGPDQDQPALQPLQALTRLVDLRLISVGAPGSQEEGSEITASMLACMHNLTSLQLSFDLEVEPGALAGKTKLQHLELYHCNVPGGRAGWSDFLSHLQQLQQLTHLTVSQHLTDRWITAPPAAYSALTASSKLQHLDISFTELPAGAWQHTFPVGRQLPYLQYLDSTAAERFAPAPDFSRTVSCCPGLQQLKLLLTPRCKAQLLAPLQGLTALHTLHVGGNEITADTTQALGQLTGLKELNVITFGSIRAELLLPLTELQQLTTLHLHGRVNNLYQVAKLTSKVGGNTAYTFPCCLLCGQVAS